LSASRDDWLSSRVDRLNELFDTHTTLAGTLPGKRWGTEQINWATVLRIAGEFQGFARDLHDEASAYAVSRTALVSGATADLLRQYLTLNRQLDRGNAQPASLGSDFGRLGMSFWPDLTAHKVMASRWNDSLSRLNQARNGIAHDDQAKMRAVASAGWPLSHRRTAERFLRDVKQLVDAMDIVVGAHLQTLFGGPSPW
jgi:hypothetical protein